MAESQANSHAALPVFQICNGTFSFVSPGMISPLHISHNAPNSPPKFCISIVFNFSWDGSYNTCTQEKKKRKTKVTLAYYRKLTLHEINSNR